LKVKSRKIRKQRSINEITAKGKFKLSHFFWNNFLFQQVNY